MRVAGALQTLLARLTPDAVLAAGPGGGFPLAVEEMRWRVRNSLPEWEHHREPRSAYSEGA